MGTWEAQAKMRRRTKSTGEPENVRARQLSSLNECIGAAVAATDIQKHYTAMTVYFHVSRSNDSGQWPLVSRSHSYRVRYVCSPLISFTGSERANAMTMTMTVTVTVIVMYLGTYTHVHLCVGRIGVRCMHGYMSIYMHIV